ncbi:MAG TPA: peptide chain release factor 1, partial [Anaerolineaceae bacterium]|nr:peptide chain release factor 1 [Anaerolineaceae bacterium]
MLEKIAVIEARYEELNRLLEQTGEDYQRAAELAKERAELEDVVTAGREYRQTLQRLEEARALQSS